MKVTPELLEKIDAGQVDLVSLLASDQELYAQLALKIQTKSGDVVPFVFNDAQQIFHKWCEDTLAADRKSTRLNSSHSGESRMPSSA